MNSTPSFLKAWLGVMVSLSLLASNVGAYGPSISLPHACLAPLPAFQEQALVGRLFLFGGTIIRTLPFRWKGLRRSVRDFEHHGTVPTRNEFWHWTWIRSALLSIVVVDGLLGYALLHPSFFMSQVAQGFSLVELMASVILFMGLGGLLDKDHAGLDLLRGLAGSRQPDADSPRGERAALLLAVAVMLLVGPVMGPVYNSTPHAQLLVLIFCMPLAMVAVIPALLLIADMCKDKLTTRISARAMVLTAITLFMLGFVSLVGYLWSNPLKQSRTLGMKQRFNAAA